MKYIKQFRLFETRSISVNSLRTIHSKLSDYSEFLAKSWQYHIKIKLDRGAIEKILNELEIKLNSKEATILNLVNSKQGEKLTDLYLQTVEETVYKIFNQEIGWAKKLAIRAITSKKEVLERTQTISRYLSPVVDMIKDTIFDLAQDRPEMEAFRKAAINRLRDRRIQVGERIRDWIIAQIF
jgi:PP-loop superfamily ATP-utilizing enzyme